MKTPTLILAAVALLGGALVYGMTQDHEHADAEPANDDTGAMHGHGETSHGHMGEMMSCPMMDADASHEHRAKMKEHMEGMQEHMDRMKAHMASMMEACEGAAHGRGDADHSQDEAASDDEDHSHDH